MLAFFGNLAPSEVLVLAVIAVLVFGRRLPEVAGKGYVHLKRWRQSFDDFRRETGIDREIRTIERDMRQASAQARIDDPFREPPHTTQATPASAAKSEPSEDAEAPSAESERRAGDQSSEIEGRPGPEPSSPPSGKSEPRSSS